MSASGDCAPQWGPMSSLKMDSNDGCPTDAPAPLHGVFFQQPSSLGLPFLLLLRLLHCRLLPLPPSPLFDLLFDLVLFVLVVVVLLLSSCFSSSPPPSSHSRSCFVLLGLILLVVLFFLFSFLFLLFLLVILFSLFIFLFFLLLFLFLLFFLLLFLFFFFFFF